MDSRFAKSRAAKAGFSLVELSIVLVILGLLVGGILTGQNLIKAAELRAVTTEYAALQTAVNLFQDKYFALPGDMPNATAFWGRADGVAGSGQCADPDGDEGTGTQTCNGDGSGTITTSKSAATLNETFRFWQHLANAGLIEGQYTGVDSGGGNPEHAIPGENVPVSKYANGGWSAYHRVDDLGDVNWYATTYGNYYTLGAGGTPQWPSAGLFTPEEAWNIDTKTDDGQPALGQVMAFFNAVGGCSLATSKTDLTAGYDLAKDAVSCALVFRDVF